MMMAYKTFKANAILIALAICFIAISTPAFAYFDQINNTYQQYQTETNYSTYEYAINTSNAVLRNLSFYFNGTNYFTQQYNTNVTVWNTMLNCPYSDGVSDNFLVFAGDSNTNLMYTSYFLILGNVNHTINSMSFEAYLNLGSPQLRNFIYDISICPTNVKNLTSNTSETADCTGALTVVANNVNLSQIVGVPTDRQYINIPFDTPYTFSDNSTNYYIIHFHNETGSDGGSNNDFFRVRADTVASGITTQYRRNLNGTSSVFSLIGSFVLYDNFNSLINETIANTNLSIPLIDTNNTNVSISWNATGTYINGTSLSNSSANNQTLFYGYWISNTGINSTSNTLSIFGDARYGYEGDPFDANFTVTKSVNNATITGWFEYNNTNNTPTFTTTNSTHNIYKYNAYFRGVVSATPPTGWEVYNVTRWINVSFNNTYKIRNFINATPSTLARDGMQSHLIKMQLSCTNPYPGLSPDTYGIRFKFFDETTLNPVNGTVINMYVNVKNNNIEKTFTLSDLTGYTERALCQEVPYYSSSSAGPFLSTNWPMNISYTYGSSNASYAQRTMQYTNIPYNTFYNGFPNYATNYSLYLLLSLSGQYVSFYTLMPVNEQPVQSATVDIWRQIGANWSLISSTLTDATGGTLVFLNPLSYVNITAYKIGYSTSSNIIIPSQTLYKIYLSPVGYSQNVSGGAFNNIQYHIMPINNVLTKPSTTRFNYTINSSDSQLQSYSMTLFQCNPICTNIFTSSQTNPNGGQIYYDYATTNSSTGTMILQWSMLRNGFPQYITNQTYYISSYSLITNATSTSISGIIYSLRNSGNPIMSQNAFAIIMVLIIICSMAFSSRAFGIGGGAVVGIIVFGMMCAMGTYIYLGDPSGGLFSNSIYLWSMWTLVTLGTISYMFMKGGG